MTAIELWAKQAEKSATAIEELNRVKSIGNADQVRQAGSWINQFYKGYLIDSILALMEHAGITLIELAERSEELAEDNYNILDFPDT